MNVLRLFTLPAAFAAISLLTNCGRTDGGFVSQQAHTLAVLDGAPEDQTQIGNQAPQVQDATPMELPKELVDPEENELLNQLKPDYGMQPASQTPNPADSPTSSPSPEDKNSQNQPGIHQGSNPDQNPSWNPQPSPLPQASATPGERQMPVTTPTPVAAPVLTPVATPLPTPTPHNEPLRPTPQTTSTPKLAPLPASTPIAAPPIPIAAPTPPPRPPELKPAPKPHSIIATPKPQAPIPIRGFWEGRATGAVDWTRLTVTDLNTFGLDLLASTPNDIGDFCPNYPNLSDRGRMDFWVKLISAIAKPESDFVPTAHYPEKFADKNGHQVISRGLLQLSLSDANGYGCPFTTEEDLYSPKLNLQCGVMIMDRLVSVSGAISGYDPANKQWLGASRYWGTMRSTNNNFAILKKLIRQSENCRLK